MPRPKRRGMTLRLSSVERAQLDKLQQGLGTRGRSEAIRVAICYTLRSIFGSPEIADAVLRGHIAERPDPEPQAEAS